MSVFSFSIFRTPADLEQPLTSIVILDDHMIPYTNQYDFFEKEYIMKGQIKKIPFVKIYDYDQQLILSEDHFNYLQEMQSFDRKFFLRLIKDPQVSIVIVRNFIDKVSYDLLTKSGKAIFSPNGYLRGLPVKPVCYDLLNLIRQ